MGAGFLVYPVSVIFFTIRSFNKMEVLLHDAIMEVNEITEIVVSKSE